MSPLRSIRGLAQHEIVEISLHPRRCPMNQKYIVRLSDEERAVWQEIVKRLEGPSEKIQRAMILLKADADGPAWSNATIAEAFDCRVQTVEALRKRLVSEGFEVAVE